MAPGLVVAVVAVSCSGAAALCQSAGSQAGLETGNPPIRNVSSSSSGRQPRGNPLWAIPLSSLSATRERPIFLPSRRPPAPVVIASPPPPMRSLPPPSQPERPALALVGTLIGEDRGIAILLDQTTRNFLRLHTGEDHLGWTLRSVHGREAVLQKQLETIHLLLPAPGEQFAGSSRDATAQTWISCSTGSGACATTDAAIGSSRCGRPRAAAGNSARYGNSSGCGQTTGAEQPAKLVPARLAADMKSASLA